LNQGYQANYQIVVDRIGNNDTIEVQVELTPEMMADTTKTVAEREKKIVAGLKSMLGILVQVKVVEPMTIPRSEGKAKRVVDKRDLYR
jgi:phenylacetate-CoA ligase